MVREVLRRLEARGDFETVFVDLEDAYTAADAVVESRPRLRIFGE